MAIIATEVLYRNEAVNVGNKAGALYEGNEKNTYKRQEKHPGFQITPRLFWDAVTAVCYGDLILSFYYQVKPYECEEGSTDRLREVLEQELMAQIREHHGGRRRDGYRHILKTFAEIPVAGVLKRKVGVVGEIYIKYCSLGNHGLEKYLEQQDCQCLMGDFINYAIYVLDSDYKAYLINTKHPMLRKGYDLSLSYLQKIQRELYEEVKNHGRFIMDMPFVDMKKLVEDLVGNDCITGDGWLVAAEAAESKVSPCEFPKCKPEFEEE